MDRKLVILGFAFVFGFLLFSSINVSANVYFTGQPQEVYNLGDRIDVGFGTDGTPGWLQIDLMCGNLSRMVDFRYLDEEEVESSLNIPLTNNFLRNLKGDCSLKMTFEDEVKESLGFKISNEVITEISFNQNSFNPNETLIYTGSVRKPNGEDVVGFAEVSFNGVELESVVPVNGDSFSGEIFIPGNIASGNYAVETFVYEKDKNEEVTNFGFSNASVTVLQQPKSLEVEVSNSITPGENLEFSAILFDQAGYNIDAVPVEFEIYNVEGERVLNVLGETGTSSSYSIRKNAPYGYWNVSANAKELSDLKNFYVDKYQEAEFELVNNTLKITNIGNINYDKHVEIGVGNQTEVKNLNLSLGESAEFKLSAPDGEYEINVKDGVSSITGNVVLTGDAISIEPVRRGVLGWLSGNFFAWIFIILVFGLFILLTYRKVVQKKFVLNFDSLKFGKKNKEEGKPTSMKVSKGGVLKVGSDGKKSSVDNVGYEASSSLVIDGQKQNAGILALKIKNHSELDKVKGSNAHEAINKVVDKISHNGGKVYRANDYIVGIFSPSITKTFDNSLNAIKTGKEISDIFAEHNKKYSHKIKYGIGVNEGEIVTKKDNGKFLFTPLRNVLSQSKMIADISEGGVLMSESSQKKVMSKVKAIPNQSQRGIKTFAIGEINDNRENQQFIEEFLKRNKGDFKQLSDYRLRK